MAALANDLNTAEARAPIFELIRLSNTAIDQGKFFAGEYAQARDHLERALALFQPGRDDDLAFRFGHDGP